MRITFLGAAKTVTGSCYLVETGKVRFIVDCGMFQGRSAQNSLNEDPFPFNPGEIDFLLLTHSHIDHSGRIPKLYIDGFKGDIFTTKASAELCSIMLPDSGHIQEFENEWENRKRLRAGKPPVKPLYTLQDAKDCLKLFRTVKYSEIVNIKDSISVKFNDAGHILGSSIIEIWITEDGKTSKIVFSGDLGNNNMPILRDPTIIEEADFLVIESTYGNRLHNTSVDKTERFVDIILETVAKGGNVVIPSFAVGRTQEILYDLHKQSHRLGDKIEKLMSIPVVVDSPLATSATQIFRNNLDCFDEEARAYVQNGENPLDLPKLRFTASADESKELNESKESMIIISASGMCEAGRIKHHLKHNLWRKESAVLFVGYQAEGTLGRKLVEGAKKVKIFGEEITVNARVEMLEGFSGHADRDGLLNWIAGFKKLPSKIFIVHGEIEGQTAFAESIKEKFSISSIIPGKGESFIIKDGKVSESQSRNVVAVEQQTRVHKRLDLLDYMDKLKGELDELRQLVKTDLQQGKSDLEIDAIKAKLQKVEKSFLDVLK